MAASILYLGSQSPSRQQLLRDALIPFTVVAQEADEHACDWGLPVQQLVQRIAEMKMDAVMLPHGMAEGQECLVLTADTLTNDHDGNVYGKPESREQAIRNVTIFRKGCLVGTSFCLEKRVWRAGAWQPLERVQEYVAAECVIDIPDHLIGYYFDTVPSALQASGGIKIEEFGAQFVQSVSGSYTTIFGLPMYEVRRALERLGFAASNKK